MTEAEWLVCKDPQLLAYHLWINNASERKLRLYAVACCRRVWSLLTDQRSQKAVEVAERYADGLASVQELSVAWDDVQDVTEGHLDSREEEAALAATFAITLLDHWDRNDPDENAFFSAAFWAYSATGESADERFAQCQLLRDIFGNPFRPVTVDPRWLTSDVVALAQGIYEDRVFGRLPILADALQDAGCENEAILTHCRDPQLTHVRGCWAVDLVLGKS